MKRQDLLDIAMDAARDLPNKDRFAIEFALTDPEVKRVARGTFAAYTKAYGIVGCPLSLARVYDPNRYGGGLSDDHWLVVGRFDRATRGAHSNDPHIIEIED